MENCEKRKKFRIQQAETAVLLKNSRLSLSKNTVLV